MLLALSPVARADTANDYLDDAQRLLRVSNTEQHFLSMTSRQVRDIIRTYSSIVAMEVDVNLPRRLTNSIANCYIEMYAWENFELGIARILEQQLTQKEILLLIDFYRDLGHPPSEIEFFKATIAKAPLIEQISADYIFTHSDGCVDNDAAIIYGYLATQRQLPPATAANP